MKAKGYTSPQLRRAFVEFFLKKDHVEVPPAPEEGEDILQ